MPVGTVACPAAGATGLTAPIVANALVGSPANWAGITVPTALFPALDAVNGSGANPNWQTIVAKAIWNYNELTNEDSYGIHNFPFTTAVFEATMQQLSNYAAAIGDTSAGTWN
jgi:hypothetical protein